MRRRERERERERERKREKESEREVSLYYFHVTSSSHLGTKYVILFIKDKITNQVTFKNLYYHFLYLLYSVN